MNYALIKNGIVQNIIVAEPDFLELIKADYDVIKEVEEAHGAFSPGWSYNADTDTYSAPPIE